MKLLLISISGLLFMSCIKDEPQWREADIVDIVLPDSVMAGRVVSQENSKISIVLKPDIDYKHLVPDFILSEGATISPKPGEILDLTTDVEYTVTSQDGSTTRKYTITTSEMSLKFDFDDWNYIRGNKNCYPKYDDVFWDCPNSSFILILNGIDASLAIDSTLYPTRPTTDAVKGNAAMLQSKKGGKVLFYTIPLVAGSMFMGKFSISIDPIKSAKFGQILPKGYGKPSKFVGYYKYKSGETYQYWDKSKKEVSYDNTGRKDKCSIYAIIFKVTKGSAGLNEYLDGTNVQTDSRVVAKAAIENSSDHPDFSQFTRFEVPFLNKDGGRNYELDHVNNDYKIAIVLSSSEDGDNYQGAEGSTLIVDEFEIITQLEKQ